MDDPAAWVLLVAIVVIVTIAVGVAIYNRLTDKPGSQIRSSDYELDD
jgi:hypothetical protein